MRLEKSLVLIKPDAVERNLIGKILEVYEGAGLKIAYLYVLHNVFQQIPYLFASFP